MSKARLVITAVLIEGRSQSQVARDYGVSQSWIPRLIARYTLEGDRRPRPRSRRPHTSPTRLPQATIASSSPSCRAFLPTNHGLPNSHTRGPIKLGQTTMAAGSETTTVFSPRNGAAPSGANHANLQRPLPSSIVLVRLPIDR